MNLNRPNKSSLNSVNRKVFYIVSFLIKQSKTTENKPGLLSLEKILFGTPLFYHFKTKKVILLTQYFVNDTVIGRHYIGDILDHPLTVIF